MTTPTTPDNSQTPSVPSTALSEAATSQTPATPAPTASDAPATPAAPANGTPAEPPSTDAPATPAAAEQVEEYEIEVADDSPLTDVELAEIGKEAERLGLSKEDAQKLVATREADYKRGTKSAEDKYVAKYTQQREQLMAAPEFVGEAKAVSFASIGRAVAAFGDADLVAALNTPEVGNNLPLARFLKRIGDLIKPDDIGNGKGVVLTSNSGKEKSLEEKMYPDMFDEKN